MHKFFSVLICTLLVCLVSFPALGQEAEPNNTIATANDLNLNELLNAQFSQDDTLDVFKISVDDTKMYTIATVTDPNVFSAKTTIKMDVVDVNDISILTADPSSRYDAMGARLTGWVPPATGEYYVKVWASPDKIAEATDPSYGMRLWYGTPVADALIPHEPDDTVAEAALLPATPTDGTMIRGYLYNNYVEGDSIDTNWNDFDLYKVEVPEAGMVMIAETFTSARLYGHPEWIRDLDTEIRLLLEDGTETDIKNDDKDAWAGDHWEDDLPGCSNTYSRFVSPGFPAAGTYYVRVNSYYNSIIREKNPANTDRDPGGGEYMFSVKLLAADDPSLTAQALPLNELKNSSFTAADTLDIWSIYAENDKMYTLATVTDPNVFSAKTTIHMDVMDEDGVSILTADPSSRYDAMGARLTGWVPPETGVYYVKVWASPDKIAEATDPSYGMRFWYGTPVADALIPHEPDDTVAEAALLPPTPTDGTMIRGYLYNHYVEGDSIDTNWNDFDLYKVEVPEAGMVMIAETFTSARLYDHPEWIRDLDTEIRLLLEDGTETDIKNDDKDAWAGDHWEDVLPGCSNTYSRFVSPGFPAAGTYYVRVNSYYNSIIREKNPANTDRDPGGGEYMFSVKLLAADDPSLTAQALPLNELKNSAFSSSDTLDVWSIFAENDKMYTISTVTDPNVFSAKTTIHMDVTDANGVSILTADPSSRYDAMGARLTGWVPPETGVYYVKVWASPDKIAEATDPSYGMRFWYGTPVAEAAVVHEPDDTVEEAALLPATPTDGTMIRGYLYNNYVEGDSIDTNWNDFDLYKVEVPEAGMVMIAETYTSARLYDHPEWIRDLDTEIRLLLEDGTETDIKNDDKDAWAGDHWEDDLPGCSNTYSRFVSPGFPAAGTYYVRVNSYYNSIIREKNPANTDRDPGGGEYMFNVRVVPADHPMLAAQSLPLNELKNSSFTAADTLDIWSIYAENDKMYTLATVTDPNVFSAKTTIKMDVTDEDGVSILTSDPSSRYDAMGARLTGWVPPETGVYYVKVWASPEKLAEVEDPSYGMRFWYGTPVSVAAVPHEPDDTVEEAALLDPTPTDGTMIRGYLYNHYVEGDSIDTNWNDFDLYKVVVPQAGMIMTAETFTSARLYDHPEWIRDLDTEIRLLLEDGTETDIKNDDKDAWAGDHWENDLPGCSNTYSRFVSPPFPAAGTYYVRVNSYYNSIIREKNPANTDKDPGGGEYMFSVTLTLPAEQEPNNDIADANLILLDTVTDAALAPEDSVDYFKFMADTTRMYTLNTIGVRGVSAKSILKMDVLDETGTSILNADPSSRYDGWGARLTGWVPPANGVYYCKISADVSAFTEEFPYQVRLWYGTPVSVAAEVHEPDDSVAVAQNFETIDLTAEPFELRSYLYAPMWDSLGNRHNWNDFDLYKIQLTAGDTLVAEVFTPGPDSCIRDLDTEIYLLLEDGTITDIKNDDKDAWEGDPWEDYLTGVSNTYSRFVTPPVPADGIYYVQVNSFYNSRIRERNPLTDHKDPGGGEYLIRLNLQDGVGVNGNSNVLPTKFALNQNYPNPFNPTTTISYALPKQEHVKLYIYNMLGQKVTELVNKSQVAGNYSVVWDARDINGLAVSSGVYFFRIEAGTFTRTNKMILLK